MYVLRAYNANLQAIFTRLADQYIFFDISNFTQY